MPISTFSKVFNSAKGTIKKFLPIVCGVPESVLSGISNRYIMTLRAYSAAEVKPYLTVYAYLQDKFSMSSGTQWTGIIQDIPGGETALKGWADSLSQAIFGKALISTISQQRKWAGSEPIGLTFKLKFEAVNSVETEVLQPCRKLQGLTLPREGVLNTVFLTPPGPNPYTFVKPEEATRGDNIVIDIGSFIRFRSVIVRSVKVTYENRMASGGPIGAEVELGIETWRMLTREELDKSYTEMQRAPANYYLSASTGL